MTRRALITLTAIFLVANYPLTSETLSDTLYTDDGRELHGIVVEDYSDRIVMSTVDGEVTTLKSEIKQLYYDNEADNLIKLAEQSRKHGDMIKAFAYYDMAMRADPNSKAAKDGIIFLQGYLFRKEQVKKEDEIKKQAELERFGVVRVEEVKPPEEAVKDLSETMRDNVGISLSAGENGPIVDSVRLGSPASEAGMMKGDAIVAVWGHLTGYMPLEDVIKVISEKPSLEIKCTVERTIAVKFNPKRTILSSLKDMMGASFILQFDGLTVSDVAGGGPAFEAGLVKGDLVVAIDGRPTRYLPLKRSLSLMRWTRNDFVMLKIRREILIWRKA